MSTASLFLIYLFRAHARRRMTSSPERERSLAPNLRDLKKKGRSLRGCLAHSQERDLRFAWLVAHDAGRRIDHEPHLGIKGLYGAT